VEVVITPTADDAARVVADVVLRLVTERPAAVVGLATGTSPLGAYRLLIEEHRAGKVFFAACRAVLLDEYVGLPPDHPEAYRAVIRREFTDHVDLTPDRLHGPDVWADDLPAACARYDRLLAELGGVDLQLLGIGTDGHVGFNEPGSSLRSRTRVKTLTTATRADNARFFASPNEVPHHVVTQGLGTITDSRHALLVATGAQKAEPVARAVEGPLAAVCPASVLQLHPHATVVVDEAAASDLQLAEYYREAYAGKPSWQQL
jgi:glucosamine-6-phosphate deaminase